MADRSNNLYYRLYTGEKVKCPNCEVGIIKPFNNTSPDRAHSFVCTNEKCDFHLHVDPMIIVE